MHFIFSYDGTVLRAPARILKYIGVVALDGRLDFVTSCKLFQD